jgi:hypothetical protein
MRFPALGRLGLGTIGFGLLFDLVEHTLVFRVPEPTIAGLPLAEHAAHAIVLFGMVLVLVAIVADGMRASASRDHRPESRSDLDALR